MKRNKLFLVVSLIIVATMILAACAKPTAAPTEAPTAAPTEATAAPTAEPTKPPTTRHGGWFDEIDFSVVTGETAITQLKAGVIDIYADGLAAADLPAIKEAGLDYATSAGTYYDLLFNPAVFKDTNVLNPFSDRKIREAMNYLVDRDYINQEIYAGGALPKWFAITTQFPDYADLAETVRALETKYAYNPDKAKEIITTEMGTLGATLENGKWMFKGKPVTLIFLIRNDSDGTRKPLGDYVANQLETLGFTVDRQYKKSSEASPLWIRSQPDEGKWSMYTAAWSATVLDRNQANIFQEMYLPTSAQGIPVFLANVADPEFQKLGDDLFNGKYTTLQERHDMMKRALELSLQDSLQVFLIDGKTFIPYVKGLSVTYDLAAGVQGAQIWPYTLRWADKEGGTLKWATQGLFGDPWNPIAGGNWAYDQAIIRATQGGDIMYDPYTGLTWPLRIEKAEVVAQTGLPVTVTNDWVTLSFQDKIDVPADAWIDWDATTQKFITVGEKNPEGLTAKRKTTYYYPADLYTTVKWHDGSNFSIADVVMGTIMTFDRAKKESKIYDEQAVPGFEQVFQPDFKGVKIVSTDPLVIEYYSDTIQLDAELNTVAATGWPTYTFGDAPWDTLAIANLAEENGELAYSIDKAGKDPAKPIEQTSFIGGPSLEILSKYLDKATAENYIPYAPTMSQYITTDEVAARYANLKTFYTAHNHFWVGTGPYLIDKVFLTEKSLVMKSFADYPDLADRWANYGAPKIADVTVDGPGQVKMGDEAVYTVSVSFEGAAYPQAEIKQVKFLLYNAKGEVVIVGEATAVADGEYTVSLAKDVTAKLEAGSNKLEVVVLPTVVSVPTFTSIPFVTAP